MDGRLMATVLTVAILIIVLGMLWAACGDHGPRIR